MSGNTSPCYFIPSWSGLEHDVDYYLLITFHIPLTNAFLTYTQVYSCVEDVSFSALVAMKGITLNLL